MERLYDQMDELEDALAGVDSLRHNIRQQKITGDNVYQHLLYFDRLYEKFTDKEKKEFLHCFIDRIEIYEDEQLDGRFLKSIFFKYPVFYDGQEILLRPFRYQERKSEIETTGLLSFEIFKRLRLLVCCQIGL